MVQKKQHSIELKDSQVEFLKGIVAEFDLPDMSKAVRILVEYAIANPSERDHLFREVRCRDC